MWQPVAHLKSVSVAKPRLASWDAATHPSQIRLKKYLVELMQSLGSLPDGDEALCLHYAIGVASEADLLTGCDLENYLTPLFGRERLPANRFVLVEATKQFAAESRLSLGIAGPIDASFIQGWKQLRIAAGSNSQSVSWRLNIQSQLAEATTLAPGPVEVQILYECSSARNWTSLWKPSGDAMGPILGYSSARGFSPCDDRIVNIRFHKRINNALGHDVHLTYFWKLATTAEPTCGTDSLKHLRQHS